MPARVPRTGPSLYLMAQRIHLIRTPSSPRAFLQPHQTPHPANPPVRDAHTAAVRVPPTVWTPLQTLARLPRCALRVAAFSGAPRSRLGWRDAPVGTLPRCRATLVRDLSSQTRENERARCAGPARVGAPHACHTLRPRRPPAPAPPAATPALAACAASATARPSRGRRLDAPSRPQWRGPPQPPPSLSQPPSRCRPLRLAQQLPPAPQQPQQQPPQEQQQRPSWRSLQRSPRQL